MEPDGSSATRCDNEQLTSKLPACLHQGLIDQTCECRRLTERLKAAASASKKPQCSERPATPSSTSTLRNTVVVDDSDEELPPLNQIIQSSQERKKRELTPFNSPTKSIANTPSTSGGFAYSPRTTELLFKIRNRRDDMEPTPCRKRSFVSISDDSDCDSEPKSRSTSPARPIKRRLFTQSYVLPRSEMDVLTDVLIEQINWDKLANDVATNRGISFYRREFKGAMYPPSAFDPQPRATPPTRRPSLSTYEMRRLSRSVLAQVDFEVAAEEIAGERDAAYYRQVVRGLLEKKMKDLVRREEKDL